MRKNIIFLDIDGVLNLTENTANMQGMDFWDYNCVNNLHDIFTHCENLKIVFSTSWRMGHSAINLGWLWNYYRFRYESILDVTGKDVKLGLNNNPRLDEIHEWLTNYHYYHNQDKKYVIIDDSLDDMTEEDLIYKNGYICHTEYSKGLTTEKKNEIINYFNNK